MADDDLPVFLTAEEVAKILRSSVRTLENWRLDGKGPAYIRLSDVGRARVLYNLRDLEVWIKSRIGKPGP